MIEAVASASVELGGGVGGYGVASLFKGEIELTEVKLRFEHGFCSKHEATYSRGEHCEECEREWQRVAKAEVAALLSSLAETSGLGSTGTDRIDCSNIRHSHDCDCHLGHRCEPGCEIYDEAERKGQHRHALYQLADEMTSAPTASLRAKVFKLEKENELLRDKLDETLRLVRELHEVVRGATGVKDT